MGFWNKILNRITPDYFTFEKDYLLLHEILETLRSSGMTITAMGSEAAGMIPLQEFQVETAHLHFGTLVAFLNNREDFKAPQGVILGYWQEYKAKRHEIKEIKYTIDEVSKAVETLAARNEVKKTIISPFSESGDKIIYLTKNGLASLNTKKYQKQYQEERDKKIAYRSTISTNYWMRLFTGILAFTAIMTLIVQFITCNKEPRLICPPEKEPTELKTRLKDSIYIELDTLKVVYNRDTLLQLKGELRNDTTKVTSKTSHLKKTN